MRENVDSENASLRNSEKPTPSTSSEQQWHRCRKAGLTVVISKPVGSDTFKGWINADEVERLLTPKLGPDVSDDSP